jgi:hypothetical protein
MAATSRHGLGRSQRSLPRPVVARTCASLVRNPGGLLGCGSDGVDVTGTPLDARWIALRLLLLAGLLICQPARGHGDRPAGNPAGPTRSEAYPAACARDQVACGDICCRAGERCIDGRCHCGGMICGDRCRPKLVSCAVVVRSQQRDWCTAVPAGIACGPPRPEPDVTVCEVGVVHRQHVDSPAACNARIWRSLTAEACAAYRKKNAHRPIDQFDPEVPILVTRHLDRYDVGGSLIEGEGLPGAFPCPPVRQEAARR